MKNLKNQYRPNFDPHKAVETAAFFLFKANPTLNVVKLVKLMYLAERESLLQYNEPIFGDCLVSMPYGPVVSFIYNQINGDGEVYSQSIWNEWINAKENHNVSLHQNKYKSNLVDTLLLLSDSDIEILEKIWEKYGAMDTWHLRDLTHTQHIPEWEDPNGSSKPIDYQTLFIKNGKTKHEAEAIISCLQKQADACSTLNNNS
jgi:uncharacterized phage-associated protein